MELTKRQKIIFNIVAVICIAIMAFAVSPKTLQNDTYYTVKIGEHILNTKTVDMMDPFSWHQDLKYTYPHWLYDVMMNIIYQIGSWDGIYISTIVFSFLLGIAIYFTNSKLTKNKLTSLIFALLDLYLLKDFIAARAQLVTFILFALTIYLLERFVVKPKKIYAVCLVIISLLIANLHCAVWPFFFILFLPYIAEYLFIAYYDSDIMLRVIYLIKKIKIKLSKQNNKEELIKNEKQELERELKAINEQRSLARKNAYKIEIEKNKNIKYLIIVAIICALMGLLTPLGDTPYTYLIKTMQGNTTQNINEHLPITFWDNKPILIVYAVLIALWMFTKTKIKLRDLFLIGGLMLLTIMSKRQSSMLLVVGTLIFNKYLTQYLGTTTLKKLQENITKTIGTIIGGILVISIVGLIGYNLYKDKKDDKYISESTYPVQACDFILNNIDLKNARFFNEYNYGSYMLYRNIPVFIDSRADLYAPEFSGKDEDIFSDFLDISNFGMDYEDGFEKYGITHVILYQDAKLNNSLKLDKNYKQIYSDKHFVIYERLK